MEPKIIDSIMQSLGPAHTKDLELEKRYHLCRSATAE